MGRRSTYTPEIGQAICDRLSTGESLRTICSEPEAPDLTTVLKWLDNADFAQAYARARNVQADVMDAKILDTADECRAGTLDPRVAQVVMGAYQWRAGRLAPKRYGDRAAVEVTGADGGPVQTEVTVRFTDPQTSDNK
jgi:hypothetical protein